MSPIRRSREAFSSKSSNGRRRRIWPSSSKRRGWRLTPRPARGGPRQVADPARTGPVRRRARHPSPRVCWSSWSARKRGSWPPRWKSWRSTPVIPARSNAPTSSRSWERGESRPSGRPSTRPRPARDASALEHLDNLLAAGEQPTPMLAAMSVSLLKTHHAGRLRAARLNLNEACRIAGIPAFAVDKTRKQHAHLGPTRVDHLPPCSCRPTSTSRGEARSTPAPSWKHSSSGSASRAPTEFTSDLMLNLSEQRLSAIVNRWPRPKT